VTQADPGTLRLQRTFDAPAASTVTVAFLPDGDRTTVVLEHTALHTLDSRDKHRVGWEACLESLHTRVFAVSPQPS
jgi:Activator of Hsp90 ATPase homolog 1-like protein